MTEHIYSLITTTYLKVTVLRIKPTVYYLNHIQFPASEGEPTRLFFTLVSGIADDTDVSVGIIHGKPVILSCP